MFGKQKGITGMLVTAFVLVPIVLAISFLVYADVTNGTGVTDVTSETLTNTSPYNTSPQTFDTAYPAFGESLTNLVVKNQTGSTLTTPAQYNATVNYNGGTVPATVTVTFNKSANNVSSVTADYTAYKDFSANQISTLQKVQSNAESGFKLGANLPTVLAASAIIGVIMAAFAVAR